MNAFFNKKRIYLDYAAATPLHEGVLKAMQPYYKESFANPSAIHKEGHDARKAVDDARMTLARLLTVRPEEITFTSGGTESNNLMLFGVVEAAIAQGTQVGDIEIISTAIEHPSVLLALEALKKRGTVVHLAPVDTEGLLDLVAFEQLLSTKTLLVTMAYVNSEVGVIQDIRRIVRIIRKKEESTKEDGKRIYVHTDASQAPLWLPCEIDSLGVDLMTLDAGKCYGPKGVGVLVHKRQVPITASFFGGDQESSLRPGTENVPLIVGCVEAFKCAFEGRNARVQKVAQLRDLLFSELGQVTPGMLSNGSRKQEQRVANNCNVSIPGVDGEFAVITLDTHGIACSTRSACAGGKGGGSHVVREMTGNKERADNTIRFTLGEETTMGDIAQTVRVLRDHVMAMKRNQGI